MISSLINANLPGILYFVRPATACLKENHKFDKHTTAENIDSSKGITLVSSVAGFIESPGLFSYAVSKHGVLGLMSALRPFTAPTDGLRVTAVCKASLVPPSKHTVPMRWLTWPWPVSGQPTPNQLNWVETARRRDRSVGSGSLIDLT